MRQSRHSIPPGAQRLSASQRSAHYTDSNYPALTVRAQRLSASQRSAQVAPAMSVRDGTSAQRLSASQRSAPPGASGTYLLYGCAQRLSASQRSAPQGRCGDVRVIPGAQRLSASQRSALGARFQGTPRLTVLNAFRHHRGRHAITRSATLALGECSTPFGITEVGTCVHHPIGADNRRCSTPFGITEVGTLVASASPSPPAGAQRLSASQRSAPARNRSGYWRFQVLNAFRHHRGRHSERRTPVRKTVMCSTPFGITEVGTIDDPLKNAEEAGAQRLSASQRSAPPRERLLPEQMSVLNAFRHHRGRHMILRRSRAPVRCAQRLSASQRSAPASRRRT